MIGHCPPPVHGQALATMAFLSAAQSRAAQSGRHVAFRDISGGPGRATLRHLLRRLRRTAKAARAIAATPAGGVYIGFDAGLGQIYVAALLLVARFAKKRVLVHHHTTDYMNGRRRVTALAIACAPRKTVHIVACEVMASRLRRHYGEDLRCELLPLFPQAARSEQSHIQARSRFRIGHLANLSRAKGIDDVLATAATLHEQGLAVELHLAGTASGEEQDHLSGLLQRHPGLPVSLWGEVAGSRKRRFYSEIDAFLFPTRYVHESFGIVVAEAQAAGVPVITFEAGCLNSEVMGAGVEVLSPGQDFTQLAVERIRNWIAEPDRRTEAGAAARRQGEANRGAANRRYEALTALLFER